MSMENTGGVEVVIAPLPKFVQVKESGKVYRIDGEVPAGVFVTELNQHTFEPLGNSPSGLTDRNKLLNDFSPFPLADVEFFKAMRESRTVKNITTDEIYYVLNCNLDEATLRKEGTNSMVKVPVEILYGHYKVMRDNIVCTNCQTTSLATDKILN
jgi:hypothetical protein